MVLSQRLQLLTKQQPTLIRAMKDLTTSKSRTFDCLPYFVSGTIVKGFGRGSKQLGIPTANLPMEVVRTLPKELDQGVYYGWANVDNGEVHKVVLSIGWNPFYENKEKSMESHIIHDFGRDFYGSLLKVCILGHLRPELNFESLETLIEAINNDIEQSKQLLDDPAALKYKQHSFFTDTVNPHIIPQTNGAGATRI